MEILHLIGRDRDGRDASSTHWPDEGCCAAAKFRTH